ncbi:hypothetical protein RHSIM_Rhsim01G0174200 [Rhododendron simsii]|uniref:Reverse transcriptase zinc-binding domain-containing protein n=1 Tax=Rhododendron simsii TaxID=118357 RepID=A0A834LXG0_RHOSS|nr:hypothetical protein RHSIM_Rhsim01G0174200 [Rhododendron simsii]
MGNKAVVAVRTNEEATRGIAYKSVRDYANPLPRPTNATTTAITTPRITTTQTHTPLEPKPNPTPLLPLDQIESPNLINHTHKPTPSLLALYIREYDLPPFPPHPHFPPYRRSSIVADLLPLSSVLLRSAGSPKLLRVLLHSQIQEITAPLLPVIAPITAYGHGWPSPGIKRMVDREEDFTRMERQIIVENSREWFKVLTIESNSELALLNSANHKRYSPRLALKSCRSSKNLNSRKEIDGIKEDIGRLEAHGCEFHLRRLQYGGKTQANHISGIENSAGVWISEQKTVLAKFQSFFAGLFTREDNHQDNRVVHLIPRRVTASMNSSLIRAFSTGEIKAALFDMHPSKAPGYDGMTPGFFQKYWDIVGLDVCRAVRSFFHGGKMLGSLNRTNIVLIPKIPTPTKVMRQLGFHTLWIGWVMECVKTVSFSITVNGEAGESFHPSRATERDCAALYNILELYKTASGQKVNKEKSSVFFSPNIPPEARLTLANRVGISMEAKEAKYLGIPVFLGNSKRELFSYVKDRTIKRLRSWIDSRPNSAGRKVLIKSILLTIPSYAMSCFRLPKQLMNQISAEIAKFWWGSKEGERKIHWIKWDKLSRCKGKGGLGFRDLEVFNMALIAKQGWKLIFGESSLFKRIFKGKYFPNTTFFNANASSQASWAWRSICWSRELLNKGWRWQVRSGKDIRIWEDPWLPKPPAFKVSPSSVRSSTVTYVSDLIDDSTKTWKTQLVKESFNEEEATIILSLPISTTQRRDRKVWHYSPNGVFTVKSAYCLEKESLTNDLDNHGAQTSSANVMAQIWKKLWGLPIHPKIKFFAWKCFNEALATNSALTAKKDKTTFPLPYVYDSHLAYQVTRRRH